LSAPDHHSVRRVVLPSGKMIEVVYFDDVPETPVHSSATEDQATSGLHVCPRCASETVFPLEWQEAGCEHWEMTLRCPNCEWIGGGIFEQELVERLEEILDHGTEALVRDLKRLTQANMEDETERFVNALGADAILPEDF
jgi:predicted RNA-binding Zn-ribbon protein involved in translation (DUF1610 family)